MWVGGWRCALLLEWLPLETQVVRWPSCDQPLPELAPAVPDHYKFLAAAIAARVGLVVPGDHDLLEVSPWRGREILTLRPFAAR